VLDHTVRFIRARPDILATFADNGIRFKPSDPSESQIMGRLLMSEPEPLLVYIIQTPPPTMLKTPILFDYNIWEVGPWQVEIVVKSSASDSSTQLFSEPLEGQEDLVEGSPRLILLGMAKLSVVKGHYGVERSHGSKLSRLPILMLFGRLRLPANPCRTPALFYRAWYRFMLWPELEDFAGGFPSVMQVLAWLNPADEFEETPSHGSYVQLSDDGGGPQVILQMKLEHKLHRSIRVVHMRLDTGVAGRG
jgi:hypothetical protein